MEAIRATWANIKAEWDAAVNGSTVTTVLLAANAVLGILLGRVNQFPGWPSVTVGIATLIFIVVSPLYAAMRVIHKERAAHLATIDANKSARDAEHSTLRRAITDAETALANERKAWEDERDHYKRVERENEILKREDERIKLNEEIVKQENLELKKALEKANEELAGDTSSN